MKIVKRLVGVLGNWQVEGLGAVGFCTCKAPTRCLSQLHVPCQSQQSSNCPANAATAATAATTKIFKENQGLERRVEAVPGHRPKCFEACSLGTGQVRNHASLKSERMLGKTFYERSCLALSIVQCLVFAAWLDGCGLWDSRGWTRAVRQFICNSDKHLKLS